MYFQEQHVKYYKLFDKMRQSVETKKLLKP